jgi:hypothetical protein
MWCILGVSTRIKMAYVGAIFVASCQFSFENLEFPRKV